MSISGFAHHYYKSSNMGDICKLFWIGVSGLRSTNEGTSDKKKDLVKTSSGKSRTLFNDRPGVMLINALWLKLIDKTLWDNLWC